MNQKTITLDDAKYKLENGKLMKCQYKNNTYNFTGDMEWVKSNFQIGADVTLFSTHNIKTNDPENFHITTDDGISGNMNNEIKQYHGWRGTTSDIETYSYGKRKIIKIAQRQEKIFITVGKDLLPDEK